MIIIKLACYLFSKLERDEKILNKIFEFDLKNEEKDDLLERKLFLNNLSIIPLKDNRVNSNKIILTKSKEKSNPPITVDLTNNENSKGKLKLLEIQRSLDPNNKNLYTRKESFKYIDRNVKSSSFLVDYDKDYNRAIKDYNRKKETSKLKFTKFELLSVYLCKCFANKNTKFKKALYDKSSTYLNSIIDISNVVCKLEELEKLKLILLSNEQLALFQYIAKDYVSMNSEVSKQKNKMTAKKKLYRSETHLGNTINNFFKQMKIDNFINSIDDKIIELLDEDL